MDLPQSILDLNLPEGESIEQPTDKEPRLPLLHITTEKRRGKQTTIIWAEPSLNEEQATDLAHELKQRLAVGGSSRDGEILLQGNVKDKVIPILQQLGYKAK